MKKVIKISSCFLLFFMLRLEASSQINEPSYELTPLKGKYIDSTRLKEILLVFKHVSKSKRIEKLTISGKLTYTLGNDTLSKIEYLGQGPNRHTITILDKNIGQRDSYVFNLIKDDPNFSIDDGVRYIAITLRNITDKYIDKMTFSYGLWEPNDDNIRFETKYQINIAQ